MSTSLGLNHFLKERIKQRDSTYLDPTSRANLVNTLLFRVLGLEDPKDIIKNPLFWDLVCFCTEVLNVYALQSDEEENLALAKAWSNLIYSRHYSLPDDHNALGPEKEEHEKWWLEMIEGIGKEKTLITKGYMLEGPDHEQGTWRGWRIHANLGENMIAVGIYQGEEK